MTHDSAPRLEDVNYLVVGLGKSGHSAARFLAGHGYRCRVQDTRDLPPYLRALGDEYPAIDVHLGELDDALIDWADTLVVSPGIALAEPALARAAARGKTLLGDVELFARLVAAPVIAITGSNGKSTVTTMVGEIAARTGRRAGVGGNLGTPALDLLEAGGDCYVLELSSYQLETTSSLRPRVAALLNISEDHLDRYPDYAAYVAAKHRVFRHAERRVSNFDDGATRHADDDIGFSLDPASAAAFRPAAADGGALGYRGEPWLGVDELRVGGRHNHANALAAMAIAHAFGLPRAAIVDGLRGFAGIPHRSQRVAEIDGVEWVNDSKATNVGAALASIEGRGRPLILIAGGQSKGADMRVMRAALAAHVRQVLLLGVDADRIEAAWRGAVPIECVADMAQAVARARALAGVGDCVLLAPACASFDMYSSFEARGEHFVRLVGELGNG